MQNSDNVTIVTHNQTLHSISQQIFLSCEPICEIWENLYLGKVTRYMAVTQVLQLSSFFIEHLTWVCD